MRVRRNLERGQNDMRDFPLPQELQRFSNLPDLVYRGNDEWSSACVKCGGGGNRHDKSDRFRLFAAGGGTNARVWCRRCGYFEWADANEAAAPDPVRIKEAQEMRQKLAQQEAARLRARIEELRKAAYWQGYHDAMLDEQRGLWRREGISDSLQDYFRLGFVPERTFSNGAEQFVSPAMTIPVFDKGWQVVNVQYRIINPPNGVGKYRFTHGLPAPLYLTDPESELNGPTLVVEGAKKAIVTYAEIGHKISVVAVPSKYPAKELIAKLSDCDPVYVGLDPDAYTDGASASRIGEMLGDRARFVRFPGKPDDLIYKYGLRADSMMRYISQATKAA
jgi:hypothetical protein